MIKRGDVFLADLRPVIGSEQGGIRPVLIVQNDIGNKYSPTVICVPLTALSNAKSKMPTHIIVGTENGIKKESMALCEQVRAIDKCRLKSRLCHLDTKIMERINRCLKISLGLK